MRFIAWQQTNRALFSTTIDRGKRKHFLHLRSLNMRCFLHIVYINAQLTFTGISSKLQNGILVARPVVLASTHFGRILHSIDALQF